MNNPDQIRYSVMSFSAPQLSLEKFLDYAKAVGADGIEPRIDAGHSHGIEITLTTKEREEFREIVSKSGVFIPCLATGQKFSDPATAEENVRRTKEAIRLASDLGIPRLRVFGGEIPMWLKRDQSLLAAAKALGELGPFAEKLNVQICVEAHDDWSNPVDLARLLETVDHPFVRANWDMMHTFRTAGVPMEEAFNILRPWISWTHVHDGMLRKDQIEFRPAGKGEMDLKNYFRCLKQLNGEKWASGEWINVNETISPRDEIRVFRKVEEENA